MPEVKRSVVSGFFDAGRGRDYAVKFVAGRSGYVIAFIAQGADYKAHVLRSASAVEIKSLNLNIARRGEKYYPNFTPGIDDENASYVHLKNDAVITVPCASDAVAYHIYQNGRFN